MSRSRIVLRHRRSFLHGTRRLLFRSLCRSRCLRLLSLSRFRRLSATARLLRRLHLPLRLSASGRTTSTLTSTRSTFAARSRHNESRDHTCAKRNNHFHLVHEFLTFLPLLRLYLVRRFSNPNLTNLFLPTHEAEDVEEDVDEVEIEL